MQTLTKRSTADDVLAGLDLAGKNYLLTGCATGIGFETLRSLTAHGAHVVATARTRDRAQAACDRAGGSTTAISCDQDDFAAVATAIKEIEALGLKFDATRSLGSWVRAIIPIVTAIGSKTIPQGAATTCFVAAHPAMAGKTGGFYADCRPSKPNPHADDPAFRQRLWDVSANILAQNAPA